MLFSPINSRTLITANNEFIALMRERGTARYSDFNSYDANPNVVFPLSEVPWNNGYSTFVAINKAYVGLPVFKNNNVQIFVGAVGGGTVTYQFHIFYSKQRSGKPVKLKILCSFNERDSFVLHAHEMAQKFGITMNDARNAISMVAAQATRIYWQGDAHGLGKNARDKFETAVTNAIASYPKYAGKIRRHNARMRLKSAAQVQEIKNLAAEVADPTTTHYVFTMGDKVVGGGKFMNDFCARTEANRVLMKAIVDGASVDSVMRVHQQIEVCAFKLSFNEV